MQVVDKTYFIEYLTTLSHDKVSAVCRALATATVQLTRVVKAKAGAASGSQRAQACGNAAIGCRVLSSRSEQSQRNLTVAVLWPPALNLLPSRRNGRTLRY